MNMKGPYDDPYGVEIHRGQSECDWLFNGLTHCQKGKVNMFWNLRDLGEKRVGTIYGVFNLITSIF